MLENDDNKAVNKEEEALETNNNQEVNEQVDATEAIDEIEKSVAEEAEKEDEKEDDSLPQIDYSKLSLEELVDALKKLLNDNAAHKIKSQVEKIRSSFNKKFGKLLAEKKAQFLEAGGNTIDFKFNSPVKEEYNKLLSEYKRTRDAYYSELENRLNENLEKRLLVIERLKALIDEADPKTMYTVFKEIQDSWRQIGPVPKTRYNDTWKTYHFHVERFYDLLHLSKDYRDLDFKNNLEEKLKIIAEAEALTLEKDVNYAAKKLQDLHKAWKEDIGPVASEMREEIWKKFSNATKKIHDRRHEHYKEMRSKVQEIIEKKLEVIQELNNYDFSKNDSHNDWQKSIKEIEKLRQKYFDAGKLPYAKSEEVWQKFKAATKRFNAAKNAFYKQEKSGQQDNLKKKLALIKIAESFKDSEDWEEATNTMKKIQSDWKKIGHVPRKFSDDIWKKFKAACNHYFDRYHQQKNAISKEQQVIVDAKKEFLEKLKETKKATKDSLTKAINDWNDLGRLPRKFRHLDGKFNKQLDLLLDKLSVDKTEFTMLKFTNTIDGLADDNESRKLESEEIFIRKKIDEIKREIQQLENNLGFFQNADEKNPLVVNVKNQVKDFKENLDVWKQKLSYIKKKDY
ncbi:DUF349 domain-containing protein [Polaribacter marinivivus]|uniref:DUF349 domain-containing protein n=1 Tax=Polaribacter marinivivus TaxID=1524260 RepID=A0ABV8R9K2_9FLAO